MPCIKHFLLAVSLFFTIAGFSQSEELYKSNSIPIELKTKANAVVRYDKKTINIIDFNELSVITKRIVTVFNKYGDKHRDAVQFYDEFTDIKNIEAQIYDKFGKEIKRFKERDFKDASAVSDFSIYEDDRVKYLDYIPLNYPYTVEYTSEVIYKNTAFFRNWYPVDGHYLSVQYSEYEILNDNNIPLKVKKENFEDFNIEEISEHHFVAKNIKALNYEVYTPELQSLLPKYKVALKKFDMMGVDGVNNNWIDFGKWMYDRLLVGTDDIPESTINEVRTLTAGIEDKIERAKLVYQYMQNKTRYISIQVGIGGWKPMLASNVDKLGYADCKGLTNYTKALLDAVDVSSYYTVVYGGKSIRNLDKEFSNIEGNHVILCVPNEDENIFLECTSQTNPFGFTAGFTDDRDVLLVKPDGGEIVHTKIYYADDSVQKTTAFINLDSDGNFSAEVNINSTGFQYSLHQGLENKNQRDQDLYYKEYWGNINNLDINEINIENDKEKIIFKESIKLSATNYATKTGERLIFQPNFFNKVTYIPPRYSDRKLNFEIDRSFKDTDEFIIQLPEGIKVEAMSEGLNMETKFGTYRFNIEELEENKIKYSRTYILNKGSYSKEDYNAFRDFRKEIVKNDKAKIVLLKS
ncbi:DUF3857 domain-containing protein [Winogradskyella sp. HB-48]|uniref:DUF3857 domain-containing protein n=1 Tax=Winogradskyella sp. HB-48 TaxID=3416808 RepID=UPI003CF4E0E3